MHIVFCLYLYFFKFTVSMSRPLFIFLLVIFLIHSNSFSQNEWTWISQPGETLYIVDEDVSFFFYNWPSGSHGSTSYIEKSVDGGHNYTVVRQKTGEWGCYYMEELFFLDADTGFFGEACAGTVIYKTTDGGLNWSPAGMNGPYGISMFFLRENFGYYSTYDYYNYTHNSMLFRNGDLVFETNKYNFDNEHFYWPWVRTEIYFKNDSTGLIMSRDSINHAVIIKTTDYGNTWTEKHSMPQKIFNDMTFVTEDKGFVVGNNGILLVTEDFGESWDTIDLPITGKLNSIDFAENGSGYIAGNDGIIFRSEDFGENWEMDTFTNNNHLIYIRTFSSDHTFVLDNLGNLYDNKGSFSIDNPTLAEAKLYPNPARNFVKLELTTEDDPVQVVVYDQSGSIMLTTNEKTIDISSLPQGVYVLQVELGEQIFTNKIIKN